MTTGQLIVIIFGGLVIVYVAARLATAAFFKSKQQYEQGKQP